MKGRTKKTRAAMALKSTAPPSRAYGIPAEDAILLFSLAAGIPRRITHHGGSCSYGLEESQSTGYGRHVIYRLGDRRFSGWKGREDSRRGRSEQREARQHRAACERGPRGD